jgi:DNA-binding beta-propeller fold protein YncE
MRRRLGVIVVCVLGLAVPPAAADPPPTATGFSHPESVYWDAPTNAWYVSNFGGEQIDPQGREEDGYLTKLDADGNVVAERWVEGLRSPKGMRRRGRLLYVADPGRLVAIDLTAPPHIVGSADLDAVGAQFPNDVAVDPATGLLYVSDLFGDAIYRVDPGTLKASLFLQSPALEAPNGLLVDGGKLMVASYGPGLDKRTFKTTSPGRVLEVDLASKEVTPFKNMERVGQLDGIEKHGDGYLVTDNPGGRFLWVAGDGTVGELAKDWPSAADLGLRPDRFAAVPQLQADTVRFLRVPPA